MYHLILCEHTLAHILLAVIGILIILALNINIQKDLRQTGKNGRPIYSKTEKWKTCAILILGDLIILFLLCQNISYNSCTQEKTITGKYLDAITDKSYDGESETDSVLLMETENQILEIQETPYPDILTYRGQEIKVTIHQNKAGKTYCKEIKK